MVADLEFYPGDSTPMETSQANEALQEAVLDWMDENEDYVHIGQVTPASILGTAL